MRTNSSIQEREGEGAPQQEGAVILGLGAVKVLVRVGVKVWRMVQGWGQGQESGWGIVMREKNSLLRGQK